MQDLGSQGITEAVLAQMSGTPDARLREVVAAAVRHLHEFARRLARSPSAFARTFAPARGKKHDGDGHSHR